MKNPVTVLTAMVSVEFVLYTMCLCAPQWLVQPQGTSEGLFAVCSSYEGFTSCAAFPAWMGTYSLTWMFLASSSVLSFLALLAIRPALQRGRRAVVALVLNILSVMFCVCAVVTFLVSIEERMPAMLRFLGWSFYICCSTLLYSLVVSVTLGVVEGSSLVEPAEAGGSTASPGPLLAMLQTYTPGASNLHA